MKSTLGWITTTEIKSPFKTFGKNFESDSGFRRIPLSVFVCLSLLFAGCSLFDFSSDEADDAPTFYFSHFVSSEDIDDIRVESQPISELMEHHITYMLEQRGLENAEELEDSDYLVYFLIIDDEATFNSLDDWPPYAFSDEADELIQPDSVNMLIDIVQAERDSLFFRGTSNLDFSSEYWLQSQLPESVRSALHHLP